MESSKQSYNLELLEFIAPDLYKGLKERNNFKARVHIITFFKYDLPPTADVDVILEKLFSSKSDLKRLDKCNNEFSLETNDELKRLPASFLYERENKEILTKLSLIYICFYFVLIFSMFLVEISDSVNMSKGENSLKDLLQILIGVLTAGLSQIISYWFIRRD